MIRAVFEFHQVPGFQQVAAVQHGTDTHTFRQIGQVAPEGIIELVYREQAAHIHGVEPVQPLYDFFAGTFRGIEKLATVECLGCFHAEDDRHFSVADDLPGLGGIGDDAEPALAGATVLGVDVILHAMHLCGLHFNGGHGVAVILFLRIELAENLVMHQVVDENFHARQVRPFNPFVVALMVLQRVAAGPERVVRPAPGFVGARVAGDLFD